MVHNGQLFEPVARTASLFDQRTHVDTMSKPTKKSASTIARNKRARFDYFIEETLEAGLSLLGWELKSIRAGKVQIAESYVFLRNGETWLYGAHITPLPTASTHVQPNPTRDRKLLLHKREISRLLGAVERKGYSLVPLDMYWKQGRVKLSIGLARGKKQHDKREAKKDRDWERQKERILKHS
jgi:SsrA-binding protein